MEYSNNNNNNRGLQQAQAQAQAPLIDRAWAMVHDGIAVELDNRTISLCSLCSDHGRHCAIDRITPPFQDRDRLISIRDSLQQVRDTLLFLQRIKSWQPMERQDTINRFEKSRIRLMEQVKRYEGRPLDVIDELNACFNNGGCEDKNRINIGHRWVRCWVGVLFSDPWRKAAAIAAKLLIVSASITLTAANLCRANPHHYYRSSQRTFLESKDDAYTIHTPLNVFSGRG